MVDQSQQLEKKKNHVNKRGKTKWPNKVVVKRYKQNTIVQSKKNMLKIRENYPQKNKQCKQANKQ